mmetsp:Transcript_30413/g.29770  ORF Transcript_30413/g.29770 Transcript_30413/m.29770 type:complete len:233 (+) Transcript_30413:583-1281(+)
MKGYAVGNGGTNYTVDIWPAFITTVYKFHLIPKSLYDQWNNNDCFFSFRHALSEDRSIICDALYTEIRELTAGLNWYDLYRDVYPDAALAASSNRLKETVVHGKTMTYKSGYTQAEYTPWLKDVPAAHNILLGSYLSDYCNREDVREALNIPDSIPAWEPSSTSLQYQLQSEGSEWIYKVLRNKYRILHYSGDTDGAVPTFGTRSWIKSLGWDIKEKWRYWRTDGQVSGFIE